MATRLGNLLRLGVPLARSYLPTSIFGDTLKFAMSSVFGENYEDVARTIRASNGGPVQSPQNLGSLGGWVEQAVLANASTYNASNSDFGNQPTFDFDGGDWYQYAFGETLSQPITMFVLSKISSVQFIIDGDDAVNRNAFFKNAEKWSLFAGSVLENGGIDSDTNVFTLIFNGASSKIYQNGTLQITGDTGANDMDGITIFARNTLASISTGSLAEAAVVNALATASQINQTLAFFQSVYGVSYTPVA
jgi:hypothetical protein